MGIVETALAVIGAMVVIVVVSVITAFWLAGKIAAHLDEIDR